MRHVSCAAAAVFVGVYCGVGVRRNGGGGGILGRPSHGGNEAEIFIIAILGGIVSFAILGEKTIFAFYGESKF